MLIFILRPALFFHLFDTFFENDLVSCFDVVGPSFGGFCNLGSVAGHVDYGSSQLIQQGGRTFSFSQMNLTSLGGSRALNAPGW